jgi:hypothetical protein
MVSKSAQCLYSFTVQDKDAEALSFGCLASSLEEAELAASRAGHREFLLLEVRPLEGVEIPEVGRRLAASNPFVGRDWLPLVDLMAKNFDLSRVGHSWIMDIFPHQDPLARESPYAQAILEAEGSVHAEVGPTQALKNFAPDNEHLAEWLGWQCPHDSGLPNFFRVFPPGTSVEFIAGTVIQAMTSLFGVSTLDGFGLHYRSTPIQPVAGVELLDPGPDALLFQPAFGLEGLHQVSFASLQSEPSVSRTKDMMKWSKAPDEF